MKHKFAKYILITGSVAAILLALTLLLPNLGGNDAVKNSNINNPFNSDFRVKPLKLDDRQIEFSHTDDNSGEDIIIKTDRKHYENDSWANVYISVTNTTDVSQKSALLFYFLKEKDKDDMITIERVDDDERRYLTFFRDNIKINSAVLGPALSKRETIPDSFEVRSGAQIDIPAQKTIYLMARLEYSPGTSGEFWVEALGEKGAYGLLDPKYGTTASTDTYASWYSNSWTYRRKIAINEALVSGSSSLSNFPVVISATDSTFKHTSFGGNVASSSAGFTGGGGDFVFTSSDGITKLDHEIEKYASSSGEILAWVEVASLSASADTVLYVYYGGPSSGATNQNKTGTWNANYKGVWHLPNGTTLTAKDSTSNGKDGTLTGNVAAVSGQVDGGANFDGTGDSIDAGLVSFSINGISFEFWLNVRVTSDTRGGVFFNGSGGNGYGFFAGSTDGGNTATFFFLAQFVYWQNTNIGWTQNAWAHIVGTLNASNVWRLYRDGALIFTSPAKSAAITPTAVTTLGAEDSAGSSVNQYLDEVRFLNTVLSADWIKTEYNNQVLPGFFSLGGQQTQTVSEPLLKVKGGVQFR